MNESADFRRSRIVCNADDVLTVDLRRGRGETARQAERRTAFQRVDVGRVLRQRYEIEECLGTGGKGTVFKALDRYRCGLPPAQRYVAIKLLHGFPDSRQERVEALRQELQSAQTLSHPNIVKVHDVDRDGDIDFFTMELLEGELLSDLMRRFQPQPISRADAWSLIRQIASAVEHAHARKIVHADLKPQNIMVTTSGEVRILDFGSSYALAKAGQAESSRCSPSATPAYASCELLDGRTPDPRDDLYALACIAYELLTGSHPFQRRRASEARQFGVVPVRPSGLRRRQWLALAKGLSWHRAARSIPVGDWFKQLQPRTEPAQRLASIDDLKPEPVKVLRPPVMRPFAVFSVLISIAAVSLLFVRLAPGGKVNGESLVAHEKIGGAIRADEISSTPAPNPNSTTQTPIGAARDAGKRTGAMAVNPGAPMLPGAYQVQPGQRFAEIRVHRPANARGDGSLVWWTEPASAKPGVDYVSQAKVSQPFPKGRDSMSVFVKLLPKANRRQPEVFFIAVADKGAMSAGRITHTAVRLPSTTS